MLRLLPVSSLAFPLLVALALSVGCGTSPQAATGAASAPPTEASLLEQVAPEGAISLEFWRRLDTPAAEELQQKLLAQFKAQHPAIDLQVRTFPDYQALYAETLGAMQRNDAPDLVAAYDTWAAEYYEAGALVALDPYVSSPRWGLKDAELADFFPNFLETTLFGQYSDRRLTFPYNKSVYLLYTNLNALAEAGIAQPAKRWTELDDHCARARSRTKKACLAFPVDPSVFVAMLSSQGIVPADRLGHGRMDDRGVLDVLSVLERLRGVRALSAAEPDQALRDFLQGDALYYLGSSSRLPAVTDAFAKAGRNWRVTVPPQMDATSSKATTLVGTNLALLRDRTVDLSESEVRRRLAAWLFIKFVTAPEITGLWGLDSSNGYFPLRRTVLDDPANLQKLQAQPHFADAFRIAQESARAEPNVKGWQDVRQIIGDTLVEMRAGRLDAQRAQQRLSKRSNQVLE